MGLYSTIVSIYLIVPMVFTYHHKIYLSVKPEAAGCNKINDTMHYCYSLIPMLDLLSDYNGSTDVFIQSGAYILNMSYTLKDLNNIQIRSNFSKSAIIRCYNNSEPDAGIAFLRVYDLIINPWKLWGVEWNILAQVTMEKDILFLYTVQCLFKIVPMSL